MALVLDGWRKTHDIPHAEAYDEYLCACNTRALESEDETIRSFAANSLFGFFITKENYEKTEALLPYFSKENSERKRRRIFPFCGSMPAGKAFESPMGHGALKTNKHINFE